MRRKLLEIIVCPACRSALELDAFTTAQRSGNGGGEPEVLDGALRCTGCGSSYPVIAGVPRLLSAGLLGRMRRRYPEFFAAHPELLRARDDRSGEELGDTLESFTRQRLDFPPPGPVHAAQWEANLARCLGDALDGESLRGTLVLDVGCGFGRHMYVAGRQGAEIVGIDLSGGVDRAYETTRTMPNCHVVQGNVFDRPLRAGRFDVVWSFGVLHHMPDPRAGFRAIVPFAKEDGGRVVIWVYGYEGMALTYRLSHMRTLHRRTRKLSGPARARASAVVAGALSALYWEPLRLARSVGLAPIVRRLPLADYVDHPWRTRIAGVHDRLSTPITHFHDLLELSEWCRSAGLDRISVNDTNRRGWRAHGIRRPPVTASSRGESPSRP
jgi:SAM-dependent methyltransferase